ncbi:MAG: T9SS type A sorting domain-containing protein, partial [Ignavibacteriaceae bacterium]
YYNDTLWVGDYQLSSDGNAYLYGYKLDSNGDLVTSDPPTIYRLPFQTQGAAWKIYNNKKYLFLSVSGGDTGSKIYRVKAENLSKFNIPVEDTIFTVPAGGEDLSFNQNGDLLNQSESAAKLFQKRSNPWNTYFPFVYVIEEEILFQDIITSTDESENTPALPGRFDLQNYPNPFNGQTKIKYTISNDSEIELKIYDSLGSETTILKKGFLGAGSYSTSWNASSASSGIYFLVLKANGKIVFSNKLVLMK